jgi:hypothetical protein
MEINMDERMWLVQVELLEPAPKSCAMIIHHIDIDRTAEKILLCGSRMISALERYNPIPLCHHHCSTIISSNKFML